jgi:hypothetical protein
MLKFIWVLLLATLCLNVPQLVQADNNGGQAFATWPETGQTANNYGPVYSYTKLDTSGNTLPESATSWAMIRDNVTGLIWEAKTPSDNLQDYNNPHDADNTYTWCDTHQDTNGGYEGICSTRDTEDFLAALNNGAGFGGQTDWRLPTINELLTLSHHGRTYPAIDITYFPLTKSDYYWSSTSFEESFAFSVDSLGVTAKWVAVFIKPILFMYVLFAVVKFSQRIGL